MTTRVRLGFGLIVAVSLATSAFVVSIVGAQRVTPAPSAAQATATPGQSVTLLPDGRWLLLGGETTSGVLGNATLVDPRTGVSTTLSASLSVPRANHTATVLPDGSVLVVGGRDSAGAVATVERFDTSTQAFTVIGIEGSTPRSGHTATLLTDGRILVVGGTDDGADAVPTEIWDLEAHAATALTQSADRTGHSATLLDDGTVLVADGRALDGRSPARSVIVDPMTLTSFETEVPPRGNASRGTMPSVSASLPEFGARDVPLDARLVVRFSEAMRVATLNDRTVELVAPRGPVAIHVVGAEQGRLLFVSPLAPLEEGETYVLRIDGVATPAGVPLPAISIPFSTIDGRAPQIEEEEEAWTPSSEDGWRANREPSAWETLSPLEAPSGVTALAGRVLRLNGRPLPGVTLEVDGRTAVTDRTGRFLLVLEGMSSGEVKLEIDGSTANRGDRTYGFYEARVPIKASITTALPFTIWSPVIDTARQVTIASPTTSETVVTTPAIPGLELHLPAGTVIRDEDGEVVRTLTITPIPLDRTPFPLPSDATFNMYFTIQPGGAYIHTYGASKGAWLVYPNTTDFPEGTRVPFFDYDPDSRGWHGYGMGTVTPTKVVPEPKTRFYAFTGASFGSGSPPAAGGATPGGSPTADPVDPSTGAFIMEKTDLYLPDVMPVALTRTYNSQDAFARAFGRGMTHSYAYLQYTESSDFSNGYLILPDGGRIYYVRVSDPSLPWFATVFEAQSTPTRFYKSRIVFNGNAFEARLKDGTVYVMGHTAPLQRIRDRYGNETRLTWSDTNIFGAGYGKLMRITSPNGRWIEFSYYAGTDRVSQAKDNIGRTVSYTYDASGRLQTVTDPENNVTTYTWDASNRLRTIKDGRDIVFLTNDYNATGRVLTQTLADPDARYTFAYTTDTGGNVTRTDVTNPRGFTTRFNFNADHQLTSKIEALNQPEQRTTTFERATGSHLVTAVVDGLNRRTEYEYDDFGHVQTMRQLAGTPDVVTTTYTYEPKFFQLASVTDTSEHTWSFGYNSAGRIASTTDPLTHQTTFATNAQGLITSVTDPLQHTWQSGYTGGDQTSKTNPLGLVWSSFVDGAGRVLSTTDPLGRVTRVTPDKLNHVRTTTDAMGGQTSLDYDPNGRVLSLADALTHTTSYTYDPSDRLATRRDPLEQTLTYTYDRNDNLTQVTDRTDQVTGYEYDSLDRLKLVTYADTSTTEYVYDAGDRVRQVVDSVSGTVSHDYDLLDRLTVETTPEGSVSYTYFADGRRQTMTVAGQPVVTYGYDDAHRLMSITQGESIVSLTYDNADRRSTLTLPNGIVATYGYDDADRLTALTYTLGPATVGTLTYAYDADGNRTTVGGTWARTGLPQALSDATYDAANRIATWAGQSFSYDANGNLASDGLTSYNWNARNQLAGLSGATSASFEYDGLGRRRAKNVSGVSTGFLYDGLNMVQELTLGSPSANILPGFAVDEWLLRTDAAGTRHFLPGSLGSTAALADDLGTVQTEYTFGPFGNSAVSGSASANAFGFTGREEDGTGLLFYRARYYDPSRQRFLSEDPIGFGAGDVNLYSYTFNSPTNFTDPTGEIVPALLVPILMQCLKGAGMDIGMSLLERILSGRKSPGIDELLKTGVSGCLSDVLNPFDRVGDVARMAKKIGPDRIKRAFERQLAKDGVRSLERSLRTIEQNLAEHLESLQQAIDAGGRTSSLQREIRTFQRQIDILKGMLGL